VKPTLPSSSSTTFALEGNIGCMRQRCWPGHAGTIRTSSTTTGGKAPPTSWDVGGGATKERVTEAFKIIPLRHQCEAPFLVNIFGGIVRCETLIAEGIFGAVKKWALKVPVVVVWKANKNAELAAKVTEGKVGLKHSSQQPV